MTHIPEKIPDYYSVQETPRVVQELCTPRPAQVTHLEVRGNASASVSRSPSNDTGKPSPNIVKTGEPSHLIPPPPVKFLSIDTEENVLGIGKTPSPRPKPKPQDKKMKVKEKMSKNKESDQEKASKHRHKHRKSSSNCESSSDNKSQRSLSSHRGVIKNNAATDKTNVIKTDKTKDICLLS